MKKSEVIAPGMNKARKVIDLAEKHNWSSKIACPTETILELTLDKGQEQIVIAWHNGVIIPSEMPYYLNGERQVKFRNVSAVKKQIALPEDGKPIQDLVKPEERKKPCRGDGKLPSDEARSILPFDIKTVNEEELLNALRGKKIVWRNRYQTQTHDAIVRKEQKRLRIVTNPMNNDRVVEFIDGNHRQRVVALNRLVKVG